MSAYLDPETFVLADDLLREILGALAHGHATLAKESRTPLGTLVVKEAEVTVAFDFSVQARETAQGVGLAVRPPKGGGFLLVPGLEAAQSDVRTDLVNRAQVTVRIVNVLPPEEAAATLPDRPPKDTRPEEPPREPPEKPPLSPGEVLKLAQTVLAYLHAQRPEAAKVLQARVAEIERAAQEGDASGLRRSVAAFVADVRTVLKEHRDAVPPAIQDALKRLAEASAAAAPAADTLRAYTRDRIAALAPMLDAAGVPAGMRRAFAGHATAALDSGRTMAARAVFAAALRDLTPALTGKVLPVAFFDTLDKLDLRDTLEPTGGVWRAPFEASLAHLRRLVAGLDLPRRPMRAFERGIASALASRSAVEAGSRLVAALDRLRDDTADLDLPPPVRDTLAHLGGTPRT